jgi:hypothetical protein
MHDGLRDSLERDPSQAADAPLSAGGQCAGSSPAERQSLIAIAFLLDILNAQ